MYSPNPSRYDTVHYNRCGQSGVLLPPVSLGLWHNFGSVDSFENGQKIIRRAFDRGVTHFDLANNYGPVPGSAEESFGRILKKDFSGDLRDELIISTKAGFEMGTGPYQNWGSRKYLLSSLDQSLKRMQLEYVDIFYHHRPDPSTPLEETMGALAHAVKSGRALYAGLSNYSVVECRQAVALLKQYGTPCLIHQPKYSMFDRWVEDGLLALLEQEGVGCIPFSPLSQGMLTNKYLDGIPANSRAANPSGFLKASDITPHRMDQIRQLGEIAFSRGQSIAQMALAWLLKDRRVTTVLIGARSVAQLDDSLDCIDKPGFSETELSAIEGILQG